MATHPYIEGDAKKGYNVPTFGLNNIGNTCYFNSLVQSLLSLPIFNQFSISKKHDNLITNAYSKILEQTTRDVGELLRALMHLRSGKTNLHFGAQEDANEGLVMLLDEIGMDVEHLFNVRYAVSLFCTNCNYDSEVVVETAKCEVFIDYYGDVPLKDYIMSHQNIPEDYKCEKCGMKDKTVKCRNLRRISTFVVIVFKKYDMKKLIEVPTSFIIDGGAKKYKYEMRAQIEHLGVQSGGHYIAMGMRQDGNVYIFNDSSTTQSPGFKITPNTYMVFYHLETIL